MGGARGSLGSQFGLVDEVHGHLSHLPQSRKVCEYSFCASDNENLLIPDFSISLGIVKDAPQSSLVTQGALRRVACKGSFQACLII